MEPANYAAEFIPLIKTFVPGYDLSEIGKVFVSKSVCDDPVSLNILIGFAPFLSLVSKTKSSCINGSNIPITEHGDIPLAEFVFSISRDVSTDSCGEVVFHLLSTKPEGFSFASFRFSCQQSDIRCLGLLQYPQEIVLNGFPYGG